MKKIKQINFSFMIPGNLNLVEFLKQNQPDFKYKVDNFAYILNLMYTIPAKNRAIRENSKYNGKVPINAQKLQTKIRNYRQYLDYLIKFGILDTDNIFIKNEKSTYYWFTDKYKCIAQKYPVKSSITKKKINKEKFNPKTVKFLPHLAKSFDENLQIDYTAAISHIKYKYELQSKTKSKKKIAKAIDSYNYSLNTIDSLQNQMYFFHNDDTGERLHTVFTNMSSDLRSFITYNGKQLGAADIKNSQPYFSLQLLNPGFYTNITDDSINLNNLNNGENPNSKLLLPKDNLNLIYYILGDSLYNHKCQSISNNDILKYRQMVIDGTLYEHFMKRLKEVYNIAVKDRKQAKYFIFIVLYSGEHQLNSKFLYKLSHLLEMEFPTVFRIFKLIKDKHHEALSIILQRIESSFILNEVTPAFASTFPKAPLYTIHDSVVTYPEYLPVVKEIITNKAIGLFGEAPKVDTEIWSSDKFSKS